MSGNVIRFFTSLGLVGLLNNPAIAQDRPSATTPLMDITFDREVRDYPGTVFVLFYTTHADTWTEYDRSRYTWKALYKVGYDLYETNADGHPLKFTVFDFMQYAYTDVPDDQGRAILRQNYNVTKLPTTIVFRDGKEIDRMTCVASNDEQKDALIREMKEQWIPSLVFSGKRRALMYENSCELHKANRKRYKPPK